jgi:hypothetical protein
VTGDRKLGDGFTAAAEGRGGEGRDNLKRNDKI